MTTIFDRALFGFRFVDTRRNDTLQDVALRELGDAARWPELISYNNLVPPFLVNDEADARPGVVVAGTMLLVPAPAPSASTTDPNEVFGVDVQLGRDGALLVENGDFLTVRGVPNFRQALQNAVATDRGELIFHARYGSLIRRLIGRVNGPTVGLLGAQYGRSSVVDDPRVNSVKNAVATVSGDRVDVVMEVEAVNGTATQLGVSL